MKRRDFLTTLLGTTVATGASGSMGWTAEPSRDDKIERLSCDTLVYGSTPGGIAAAVEAARRGSQVVLACPKKNPGGMTASGLCTTDAVRRHLFGGFVLEFITKVREHYQRTLGQDASQWRMVRDGWNYEPSVAERVFRGILESQAERLRWLPQHWLVLARTKAGRVEEVMLEGPGGKRLTVSAHSYIDGTYEGDLAARAGAAYRVGRESRQEFGEPFAGIYYMNWRTGRPIPAADSGEASPAIQAFCCRCIFTDDPDHRIAIQKPAAYDQHLQDFVPLLADFASGRVKSLGNILPMARLPYRKLQANGHIEAMTSLNCPGANWTYPEAARHHRQRLDQFHQDHAAGLLYFLQHDPHVPASIADAARRLGLHDQEFADHGHWPWQLYVRQGRRIEGRAIMTQHNFTIDPKTGRTPAVPHPIALGEHSFDVHPCHDRRFAVDGFMEGVLWYPKKAEGPAQPGQIPYGAMVPKGIDNLLVPVALSSTHVAMSVLRMEPVWMTTGQVAGLAATVARDQKLDMAQIDPDPLPKTLGIRTEPGTS